MFKKRFLSLALILALLFTTACVNVQLNITVKFESNGGTPCASAEFFRATSMITMPDNPVKEGYTFGGWYWDNGVWEKPFTINSVLDQPLSDKMELTVYAKWLSVNGGGGEYVPAGEYVIPKYTSESKLKIMAWHCDFGGADSKGNFKQQWFDDCAEAGFNILIPAPNQFDFAQNSQQALKAMDYAAAAGLRVMVQDSDVSGAISSDKSVWNPQNIELYKNHQAFAGLNITDEPRASDFQWIKDKADKFYETFPDADKLFYVNLLPSAVGSSGLGAPTFKAYLDDYMRITGGNILSYDNFCLLQDNTVRSSFFSDTETARKVADKYNAPLVNYLQSIPIVLDGGVSYKDPTEADLRWQIAVNQAYGLDGFAYFSYTSLDDWGPVTYGDALVTDAADVRGAGVKLPKYHYAKTVNNEALSWDNVYLNFKWKETFGVKDGNGSFCYLFAAMKDVYDAAVDQIDGLKGITSTREILLGCFDDKDGNKGFMLTNATNPSEGKTANVTLQFKKPTEKDKTGYSGVQIYEKGVPRIIDLDAQGKVTVELEPGEGKFAIPLVKA